jgi:type II secretory pathway pseudopilin PulG
MAAHATKTTAQAPAAALRGRLRTASGLSLVEVTVMLVILMALAGALVPVVGDSIESARFVRARNDLSQLAVALTNFQRDVGPFVLNGAQLRQAQTAGSLQVVDVLVSDGRLPGLADTVPVETLAAGLFLDPSVSTGSAALSGWVTTPATDRCDLHLRVNGRGYVESQTGPNNGWNGPYISKPLGTDPWGHAYLINTGFLRGLPPRGAWCRNCAVYAISAGPNGVIETPFQQPHANANLLGDDLAVRIQ